MRARDQLLFIIQRPRWEMAVPDRFRMVVTTSRL
jgi:hypothetical protein